MSSLLVSATVPAVAAFLLRWRVRGRAGAWEEIERAALLALAAGLLVSNGRTADWPVLAAHAILTTWVAFGRWPQGCGLWGWVLVWAFHLSPLFPQKVSHLWMMALAGWLWWHVGRRGLIPSGRLLLASGLVPAWAALAACWILSVVTSPCPSNGVVVLHRWMPSLAVLVPLLWASSPVSAYSRERTLGPAMERGVAGTGAALGAVKSWSSAGAVVVAVLMARHFLGEGLDFWAHRLSPRHVHPNALAFWLVGVAGAGAAWWLADRRAVALACFCAACAGIFMTGSKAGLACVWLGLVVLAWHGRRRTTRMATTALLVVAGLAVLAVKVRASWGSVGDRMVLAESTARLVSDRPLLGWGLGSLHLRLRYGWEHIWQAGVLDWHSHNLFLQTAEDSGILGAICLVALLVLAVVHGRRWRRVPLLLVAFFGMFDFPLRLVGMMPGVVLAVGLCAPVRRASRRSRLCAGVGVVLAVIGALLPVPEAAPCFLDPAEQLSRARRLWDAGRVDESLEAYQEAGRLDPGEVRAVDVWEEGGLRSLSASRRGLAASMLARAVLVRPEVAGKPYWARRSIAARRLGLPAVLARAEEDAREMLEHNPAGGTMLLWNLTLAFHEAGMIDEARRVFVDIRNTPQMRARAGRSEDWDEAGWGEGEVLRALTGAAESPGAGDRADR